MRSADEIKKGLELCYEGINCSECPYVDDCFGDDETPFGVVMPDAIALIQQLQAENAEKDARIQQLEAERDAVIADMTEMARSVGESVCEWCDQTECECTCAEIGIYAGFNWRGVQKEE